MKTKRIITMIFIVLIMLTVLVLLGCGKSGEMDELRQRIEELESTSQGQANTIDGLKKEKDELAKERELIAKTNDENKSLLDEEQKKNAQLENELEELKSKVINTEDMVKVYSSYNSGVRISFYHPENAVFVCHTEKGSLYETGFNEGESKTLSQKSGDRIGWWFFDKDEEGNYIYEHIEEAIIDIIVKIDDKIVGFAVIDVVAILPRELYSAKLRQAVLF